VQNARLIVECRLITKRLAVGLGMGTYEVFEVGEKIYCQALDSVKNVSAALKIEAVGVRAAKMALRLNLRRRTIIRFENV
jgi:hypothetical protein